MRLPDQASWLSQQVEQPGWNGKTEQRCAKAPAPISDRLEQAADVQLHGPIRRKVEPDAPAQWRTAARTVEMMIELVREKYRRSSLDAQSGLGTLLRNQYRSSAGSPADTA